MSKYFTVTIQVEVFDSAALKKAAWQRAKADGMSWKEWQRIRKENGGTADDLQMIFDPGVSPPGTSIQQSSATNEGSKLWK